MSGICVDTYWYICTVTLRVSLVGVLGKPFHYGVFESLLVWALPNRGPLLGRGRWIVKKFFSGKASGVDIRPEAEGSGNCRAGVADTPSQCRR